MSPVTAAERVILLEFNELCPPLMERWMAEGRLPSFARLHRESAIHTTESDEDAPLLEPWIQWITVHCGLPYQEHRIHDLGDGHKLRAKNVWDLLSDEGRRVWVCGSMNVTYQRPIQGWVLPDPWTTKVDPWPADELRPYFRFVSANVQEYTRDETPLSLREKAEFVAFMARHGLSVDTAAAIARQLASERLAKTHWKRAVILDRLQFDLFRWYFGKARPHLSTFFLNSTAHFQHLYWRHMAPELFQVKPSDGERSTYANAILYGYQQMDRLVGRFLDLAGDDVTLVFLTALSQQPCLDYEAQGGKTIYRPRDFAAFLRAVGVTAPAKVSPVMAHQFHLDFETEDAARDAEARLAALQYTGRGQAVRVERDGRTIFGGCRVFEAVPADAVLTVTGSDRTHRFFDLFYHIDLVKSGMHHRDGMMWIRTPERRHLVNADKVPLVAVAPTILDLFGVKKPSTMKGEPITRTLRRAA